MNNVLKYIVCFISLCPIQFTFPVQGCPSPEGNVNTTIEMVKLFGNEGELTMDELWKAYRKDRGNLEVQQKILGGMPQYSASLANRSELEKWQVRVEELFKEYWTNKPHEDMFNVTDLRIIMLYSQKAEKNNEPIDFLIRNFEKCCSIMPAQDVLTYIAAYMNSLINRLAKAGDINYKKELARLDGDLKPIFSMVQTKSLPVEYLMTAKADALYALYGEKNQQKYVKLQQEFLEKMGNFAGLDEYKTAALTIMLAVRDKLTGESAQQCLLWLDKVTSFDVKTPEKVVLVSAMGDCYTTLNNFAKAKECYNQAYLLSLQLNDPRLRNYVRQKVSSLKED